MQTTVTRGWTSSELELETARLLELVYDSKDAEGGVLDLRDPDALGGEPDLVGDAARLLVGDQLVHGGETLGGIGYSSLYISDAGRAVVRARRERRTNRVERAIACREALLNWTYTQSGFVAVEDFAADVRAHFEGDPSTEEEIRTAAADLKTKGLVQMSPSTGSRRILGTLWARRSQSGDVRLDGLRVKVHLTRNFAVERVTRIELA